MPKPTHQKDGFVTEYAFTSCGVDYYEFKDKNTLPHERGLQALTFFEELQNGVSGAYLKAYLAEKKKIMSDPKKIDLTKIIRIDAILEDRLNFIISKDLIYNVASVVFVDKNENPLVYDFAYNRKKIENWKKEGDGFFLSQPLKRLIPFLGQYGDFYLTYLKIVEEIEVLIHQLRQPDILPPSEQTLKEGS